MGAPKGNEFWKLRSKHGMDKLFTSPDLLWEAACEYFQWATDNPINEVDFRGKDVRRVDIPRMRAFTLKGLCLYLGCNSKYFNDLRDSLKGKEDDISKGFAEVITRIEYTIYEQKFSGAAIGLFNQNIIARDLGLVDKNQFEHFDGEIKVTEV